MILLYKTRHSVNIKSDKLDSLLDKHKEGILNVHSVSKKISCVFQLLVYFLER